MLTAPLLLALMLAALGVAQAQNVSEQQAAKETYIDGLRLLDAAALEPRLGTLGINIGYVERDTRPGGGRYFCGAVSRDASRAIARSIAPAFGSGRPGFLNPYSETYPHEERAELFALLLLEPAVVATHLKRTNDPVLRDKVRYVIEKCERLLGLRLAY